MNSLYDTAKRTFRQRYDRAPGFGVLSPGRINLMGDHTDYNDGFVLPMAIDRYVAVALRPRDDATVNVFSTNFNEAVTFVLNRIEKAHFGWIEYIKGVAWALQVEGVSLRGFDAVITGNIPIGAGLSSSAAMEMAAASAFAVSSGLEWDPVVMARLCQLAENKWVGTQCGIMDPLICGAGQEGHAIFIDCRSLDLTPVPLPEDFTIVVLDTTTRRNLVTSTYGERRRQCESAAERFGVAALRDLSPEGFSRGTTEIEPVIRKRAKHVILENQRVLKAVQALKAGDAAGFGKLMTESHHSLRDDFEVSGEALDKMVNCALTSEGCLGARMTGAGFFGCAVALVRSESIRVFIEGVEQCFLRQTGITPQLYACRPQVGTRLLNINT